MLKRIVTRMRGLIQRRRAADEMDDELRFHVAMETDANARSGMSPGEAQRAALRDFGGIEPTKETIRDVRALAIDGLWQDIRYAFRGLRKTPGFTTAAVVSLALGIGVATGLFTILYDVVLHPFPNVDADRLVTFRMVARGGVRGLVVTADQLIELQRGEILDDVTANSARLRTCSMRRDGRGNALWRCC
jgi:putative ABC transport system permease protein